MTDESSAASPILPVKYNHTQHSPSSGNHNNVDDVDDQADVLIEGNTDSLVSGSVVVQEQQNDETLKGCFKLAEKWKGYFVTFRGLLYHQDKIHGVDRCWK